MPDKQQLDVLINQLHLAATLLVNQSDTPAYWTDQTNCIRAYNTAFQEILRLDGNKSSADFQYQDLLTSAVCEQLQANNELALASKCFLFTEDYVLKEGEQVWSGQFYKFPISFADRLLGIVHIAVSEGASRVKQQLTSNSSDIYLKNILRYMPGSIYWKDKDGVFLGCNQLVADMAGLSAPEEIIGKKDTELVWKDIADEIRKNDLMIMQSKKESNFEERVVLSDGSEVIMLTHKAPLFNNQGDVIGVLGVSIDITDRKKLEKNLESSRKEAEVASEAKSEFIANMSHDIRTPITGLVGMMQDLLYAVDQLQQKLHTNVTVSAEKKAEFLEDLMQHTKRNNKVMLSSVDELLKLCNEILEVTRLGSGLEKPSPSAFDIRQLTNHTIELLGSAAEHNKLTLKSEISKNVPTYLHGLYSYLNRTLLNLVSNALKFTKEGGVTISVDLSNPEISYKKGDTVELVVKVKDTGIGIPADKFEVIFEHFSRLTASYKGIYKGSGLGLYTVKKYIDAMQGDIAVDSEVGKGTCFTLTLPFIVDDHAEVSAQDQPSLLAGFSDESTEPEEVVKADSSSHEEQPSEHSFRPGILVVEDNQLAGMTVSSALKRLGCDVDVVGTGMGGVEQVQKKIYNLVLMDVGLPDIDGLEATRQIRSLPKEDYHYLPIVALTGHVTDDKHKDCIEAGMDDVITKPAPPMLLESLLKRFVWEFDEEDAKEEAESAQAEQQDIATLPAIDWPGCLEKGNQFFGDIDALKEMLELCATELKKTQAILAEGYQEKDLKKLRAELHKCLGGVVFFKLPRLEQSLLHFQSVIHNEPDNEAKFSAAHQQAQEAIEAYYAEWKDLQDKV